MSRLFAEFLMKTNGIEPDELSTVFRSVSITGRYFKTKKVYEFKVLDFYSYLSDRTEPFFYKVKIDEADLVRMLKIDSYSEDEKNELYYHKLLGSSLSGEGLEQKDLDDDVFWGISILQYFFHISMQTIVEIKRQQHLYKLYKVSDPNYLLKPRVLHSNGGRKLGSLSAMTDTDLQNIENAESIIRSCVEHDWYYEFMDLYRVLLRFRKTELSLTGAKWKFYILRYKWKVDNLFISRDLEYEKTLIEKNNKYKIFDTLAF